jgi:hypothetical protein
MQGRQVYQGRQRGQGTHKLLAFACKDARQAMTVLGIAFKAGGPAQHGIQHNMWLLRSSQVMWHNDSLPSVKRYGSYMQPLLAHGA